MRLLVTGSAGQLGHDVAAAAARCGHDVTTLARPELDITDADAVAVALEAARPDAVVNCAAWTDVDRAEGEEDAATAVNGRGAGNVAAAAARIGAHLVHVSTDYVFDGRTSEPYLESSPTNPLSAYGRSKLAGELALDPARDTIVRAAWLFGAHGGNFAATMLHLSGEREELTVVDDQVGVPTYTGHLGPALVALAGSRTAGILHAHGEEPCSWYDFARAIFGAAGREVRVDPGSTRDLGRPAPRPAYSVLGAERPESPRLPHWRDGLAAYLQEIGVTR